MSGQTNTFIYTNIDATQALFQLIDSFWWAAAEEQLKQPSWYHCSVSVQKINHEYTAYSIILNISIHVSKRFREISTFLGECPLVTLAEHVSEHAPFATLAERAVSTVWRSLWTLFCKQYDEADRGRCSPAEFMTQSRCRRASGTQEQEYPPPFPLGTADPATVRRGSNPRIIGDHPGAGVPTRWK